MANAKYVYKCYKCDELRYFDSPNSNSEKCPVCNDKLKFFWKQEDIIENEKPTIKCPYCHSTATRKISGISKFFSFWLFGIFGLSKAGKQWHCYNCNSDF